MAEPKVRFKQEGGTSFPAWETVPMSEVFAEISEKNHPEMPVLSVQQGIGTVLRDSSDRNIIYDKSNLKNYKVMKKNDFIIHLRSFEGGLECSNYDGISSPAYRILRPKAILPATFRDYFRSYDFIHNKLSVAVVGIRDGKNIDMDTFWQIPMAVPSLEEQQKIADFLSSVDDVISTSEQEVANLETQKKAVMKKIFSQEVRFKRADGSNYPEWEEKTIGDVTDSLTGYAFESELFTEKGIRLLRGMNIKRGELDFSEDICKYWPTSEGLEKFLLQENDLIVQMDGALVGKSFGLVKAEHLPALLVQRVTRLRGDSTIIQLLYQILSTGEFDKDMKLNQTSTAVPHISLKDITGYGICIPSDPEEQRLIADFLSDFDEAIAAAKEELELWKELKKGLLQQMFV